MLFIKFPRKNFKEIYNIILDKPKKLCAKLFAQKNYKYILENLNFQSKLSSNFKENFNNKKQLHLKLNLRLMFFFPN